MLLLAGTVNAEKYFVLDVNHILDSVTFNSISLREIDRSIKYSDNSGYLFKTVSFDSSDIAKIYYNMSENKNYFIYIPYSENAARIEAYNLKNSNIMEIDVRSFSNTCGNGICEAGEGDRSVCPTCSYGYSCGSCSVQSGTCPRDCR